MQSTALIIAAAGQGSRMGAPKNKQFIKIGGQPILIHTLKRFEVFKEIGQIILLHHEDEKDMMMTLIDKATLTMDITFVQGGNSRQESILNGLKAVYPHLNKVMIHDGARPFITEMMLEEINRFIESLSTSNDIDGGFFGVPLKDTVKQSTTSGFVTIDRSTLHAVQTPQLFNKEQLVKAHEQAHHDGFVGTDDCSLIERNGGHIVVLPGDYKNIKVTTPEDLLIAEVFLKII